VIKAFASYVPQKVLSNADLEKYLDTSDEWIIKRTGIKERRLLERGQPSSHIAISAAKKALKESGISPEEIDLIVGGTNTPDYIFPCSSTKVAQEIGALNAACFDVQAACPAFLYALSVGSQFIRTRFYKKVLVLGFDKMSSIVDYKDRKTCVLFGDGGGCVVLEASENGYGIQDIDLGSDGRGIPYLLLPAGGTTSPASEQTLRDRQHYVYQDGKVVYKKACEYMTASVRRILERNHLDLDSVDWLIPHQANIRIIDHVVADIGIDKRKVLNNINKYGNTSAGSIPILLAENAERFKKGDKMILTSFGAGFTWATLYLTWGI